MLYLTRRGRVVMVAIIRVNDFGMFYTMEGDGVCLLFIHEVATDHRLWQSQREYFSRRYRMISIDVLGHGRMEWPRHELSIERAALHVQRLLTLLGTGPVFIIGVSIGAAVAMQVALNVPALVQGLVLVSPWRRPNDHMKSLIDRLLRATERMDMTTYTTLFLRYAMPSADVEPHLPKAELLRAIALTQNPSAVADTWTACLTFDVGNQLRQIRVPSLVVAGMDDLFTPPYLARSVAEELPIKEIEIWEGNAHFPFLEDHARFNRRLEAFILSCMERGGAE